MNLLKKFNCLHAVLLICLCVVGSSHAELLDKIVARVNSEIILHSDFQASKIAMQREVKSLSELPNQEVNKKVLDQLINEKLVKIEIKKRGYQPSPEDIQASINSVMQQNQMKSVEELKYALKQEGINFEKYKENIANQLAQGRLMSWLIRPKLKSLSDEQIKKNLEKQQKLAKAAQENNAFELYMLFKSKEETSLKDMQKINKKITTLKDFVRVAKKETQGPAKTDGGHLGVVAKTELKQIILQAVDDLEVNQKSNIIEDETGYYIVYLTNKLFLDVPITASMIEAEKRQLENELLSKAFDRFVLDLRRNASISTYL